jgi:hypothetical protein
VPAAIAAPTPPVSKPQPTFVEPETRPTLEQDDEPEHVAPEPSRLVNDPWASTPAASVVSAFPNTSMGVGEGWAETVLSNSHGDEVSTNQQAYHHAAGSPNLASAIPEAGEDPAGPIEVSSDPSTYEQPTTELNAANSSSVANQLEDQVEAAQQKPKQDQVNGNVAGAVDRIGVQFGSLGLFDQAAPAQAPEKQAGRSPEVQDRQRCVRLFARLLGLTIASAQLRGCFPVPR